MEGSSRSSAARPCHGCPARGARHGGAASSYAQHHGSTDKMVAIRTLAHYGVPEERVTPKLPEVCDSMLAYAREHGEEVGEGLELLPGVFALLEGLARRPDVVVGLVTGNLQDIAWLKMKALGVLPFFSTPNFGGFGSDNIDRGELVKVAAERAALLFPEAPFTRRVHVGDTPQDVQAAEYGGALPVGVCTGVFSREELMAASSRPDSCTVLDGLFDEAGFLAACGIVSS